MSRSKQREREGKVPGEGRRRSWDMGSRDMRSRNMRSKKSCGCNLAVGPKKARDAATMVLTDATDHGVHRAMNLSRLHHSRCEGRVDVVRHLRCARQRHRGGRAIERRGERSVNLWLRRGLGEGGRDSEGRLGWDADWCISRGGIAGLNRVAGVGRIPGLERVAGLDRVPGLRRVSSLKGVPGLNRVARVNRTSRLDRIPVVTVTMSMVVGKVAMAGIIVMAVMAVVTMTMVTVMAMPVMAIWLWMSRDGLVGRAPVHAGEVRIHCDRCSLCLLWLASGIVN